MMVLRESPALGQREAELGGEYRFFGRGAVDMRDGAKGDDLAWNLCAASLSSIPPLSQNGYQWKGGCYSSATARATYAAVRVT